MNTTDKAILAIEELSKTIAALRAERDALREALEAIRDMPFNMRFSVMFEDAQNIAREALAKAGAQ